MKNLRLGYSDLWYCNISGLPHVALKIQPPYQWQDFLMEFHQLNHMYKGEGGGGGLACLRWGNLDLLLDMWTEGIG